jgi:hypothetical protein
MSFNRLDFDTCAYQQNLAESIGPGEYKLGEPMVGGAPCFAADPNIRLQYAGVSFDKNKSMVDTNSDLLNITRDASNCSMKKHLPQFDKDGNLVQTRGENVKFQDCSLLQQEDTRLSNPACNLRGTGWNRWEWLCQDPQDRVLIPFDYHINTNILERDNHRPCIPEPMDQTLCLPTLNGEPIRNEIVATRAVPTGPPSVQWQQRERIERY